MAPFGVAENDVIVPVVSNFRLLRVTELFLFDIDNGIPLPRIARRAAYRMLAAPGTANTFQCLAISDCEEIPIHRTLGPQAHSNAVGLAPRLLSRLVNNQKWRKNFQNAI